MKAAALGPAVESLPPGGGLLLRTAITLETNPHGGTVRIGHIVQAQQRETADARHGLIPAAITLNTLLRQKCVRRCCNVGRHEIYHTFHEVEKAGPSLDGYKATLPSAKCHFYVWQRRAGWFSCGTFRNNVASDTRHLSDAGPAEPPPCRRRKSTPAATTRGTELDHFFFALAAFGSLAARKLRTAATSAAAANVLGGSLVVLIRYPPSASSSMSRMWCAAIHSLPTLRKPMFNSPSYQASRCRSRSPLSAAVSLPLPGRFRLLRGAWW